MPESVELAAKASGRLARIAGVVSGPQMDVNRAERVKNVNAKTRKKRT